MCYAMQRAACVKTAAKKVIGESIVRPFVHIIALTTHVLKKMGHALMGVLTDIMDICVAVQGIVFVVVLAIAACVSTILFMDHFVTRSVVFHV
jgi:hypothetical protein